VKFKRGFAIFHLRFLTGMLAIALNDVKMDPSALFVIFSVGLITDILLVALALVCVKAKSLEKPAS